MNLHPNLERRISAKQPIKPWLILGPLYEDVSNRIPGLTLYEQPAGTSGGNVISQVVEEAKTILTSRPREMDTACFRGQSTHWKLAHGPEKYYTWASWFPSNHLVSAFISTRIMPDQPGAHRLRLTTRIASYAIVSLNGRIVFDSGVRPAVNMEGMDTSEFEFDVLLQSGENVLTVGLFRMGRMTRVGCCIEMLDGDATVRVALGETIRHIVPTSAGETIFCKGADLRDGDYRIECAWTDQSGATLASVAYPIQKTTPIAPRIGYEFLEERKRIVLEHFANADKPRPIWSQVALYALGRYDEIEEESIRSTCEYIAARNNCSDFALHGILRLLYWERSMPHLSSQIRALMKETVLGFKYWVDEPGDTVMWMDSENHRFLFHTAEWLAGQLYPTDEFTNCRQRGLFHAAKGRMHATEWMRQRGRFGFDEWHSNTYYPLCIMALTNVYDFAPYEDHKLRLLAGMVLDYMFFNLAADSFRGAFATTHGRTYVRDLKHSDFENIAPTMWLAFGMSTLRRGSSSLCPVALATSTYRLPKIIADIAADLTHVIESKIRQGVASKGYHEFFKNKDRFADFVVYRTPDYLMSGLQDHRKGEYEPAVHVAQVTLGNHAAIFWSCPYTTSEGGGIRPDYWSGNTSLPRVIQYRNVMSLTWRLEPHAWMSHCFFEQARFDEVRFDGHGAFARVENGYVGIYSQHGFKVGDEGQYAGRELVCDAEENTWLVECGRQADWESFDKFVDACKSAKIQTQDGVNTFDSPSVGRFVTGWDIKPTINDEPIQLHGYPLVDSAWAHSDFGSGALVIRYGDETHELWFNQ